MLSRVKQLYELTGWFFTWFSLWAEGVEFRLSANSDAIAAVTAQLGKARAEIVARVEALESAVANGEDLSGPLADLKASAQSLDDLNADPEPEPEPELPAE